MYEIIETIVISGINCILPLVGFRIIFDYTRQILFEQK